jgi:hypothetical protein
VDGNDNVFAVGFFDGVFTGNGASAEMFASEFSGTNGSVGWTDQTAGYPTSSAYGIGLDNYGGLYVLGHFVGTATIGSYSFTSPDGDVFVAKLNSANGNAIWAEAMNESESAYEGALTVDNAGNVFFGVTFLGTATFLSDSVDAGGSQNAATFIAELSGANGDLMSGQVLPCANMGATELWGLSVDGSGSLFATGDIFPGEGAGAGNVEFGNFSLNVQENGSYFVQFNSSTGAILAVTAFGGTSEPGAICVDSAGNVDIAGWLSIGSHNLDPAVNFPVTTNSVGSGFVEKIDDLTAPP